MAAGRDAPGDEDERLWRQLARTVRPLRKPAPEAAPEAEAEEREAGPPAQAPPAPAADGPAQRGAAPGGGLDRRQDRRFRRGQMPIEARLDLHGMTQRRAHGELDAFLAMAQASGRRCVLVITGKGQRAPLEERAGVLRRQLPRWLALPPNRGRVLALAPAHPRHGGDGAFYILLRKARPAPGR